MGLADLRVGLRVWLRVEQGRRRSGRGAAGLVEDALLRKKLCFKALPLVLRVEGRRVRRRRRAAGESPRGAVEGFQWPRPAERRGLARHGGEGGEALGALRLQLPAAAARQAAPAAVRVAVRQRHAVVGRNYGARALARSVGGLRPVPGLLQRGEGARADDGALRPGRGGGGAQAEGRLRLNCCCGIGGGRSSNFERARACLLRMDVSCAHSSISMPGGKPSAGISKCIEICSSLGGLSSCSCSGRGVALRSQASCEQQERGYFLKNQLKIIKLCYN